MDRKEFIKSLAIIAAGGIGTLVFERCTTVKHLNYSTDENKIVIKKNEFKGNQFALIDTTFLPAPIYLRSTSEETYIALLTLCTHQRCVVDAYYDKLSCPCHGSEYSYSGEVISPPAVDHLKKFDVTTDNNNIYIHISEYER